MLENTCGMFVSFYGEICSCLCPHCFPCILYDSSRCRLQQKVYFIAIKVLCELKISKYIIFSYLYKANFDLSKVYTVIAQEKICVFFNLT